VSTGTLPFELKLVLRDSGATCSISKRFLGAEVRAVRKLMDAVRALEASPRFECYDLTLGKRFFLAETEGLKAAGLWTPEAELITRRISDIADEFRIELFIPAQQTAADWQSIELLDGIVRGCPVGVEGFSVSIVKSEQNWRSLEETISKGSADLFCRLDQFQVKPWGVCVEVGLLDLRIDGASIKDMAETLERWRNASVGEAVEVEFGPGLNIVYTRRAAK
jgi:hypothetical protein